MKQQTMFFSLKLKQLRKEAGYGSQQAFASAFGVAQPTVANWEGGRREPDQETLIRLAHFFGVSTDFLLGIAPLECHPARILPCDLNDTVYIVHRFLTVPPCIEPVIYKKLLATIDELPFGHYEAYLTEQEATSAIKAEATEKFKTLMGKCGN